MADNHPYDNKAKGVETAENMDKLARNVFAGVYPLIAEQIKERFNITSGECIDIGSGPASLPVALARITDLHIYAVDQSPHCKTIAMRNAKEAGLTDRITAIEAVAEKLPFRDNSIDLVISRSSVMFWNDLVAGFDEIYRVLKPGGNTYIGAGFGCKELKESIFAKMEVKQPGWGAKRKERLSPENQQRIQAALDKSAVCKYRMHKTETGFWICISKG